MREAELYVPPADSHELRYMRERRAELGGSLPARRRTAEPLPVPELSAFQTQLEGTDREISTTMAFVQVLNTLMRDKEIGPRVVPITPDESRTFGMEGMFRQYGIFSQVGQLYQPEDAGQLLFYREDKGGQILQEGINEAGAMSSWIAAGDLVLDARGEHRSRSTSSTRCSASSGSATSPGPPATAARRGFLIGATAGRTTLNGEGLQHQDGHSHLIAATIPNCRAYDPTFAYELAVIVQDGIRRMCVEQEDVFYYLTVENENYAHPPMPAGRRGGDPPRACTRSGATGPERSTAVRLLGSGAILQEVVHAADLLAEEHGIGADVWSVTSFTELRREGMAVDRWNLLHPLEDAAAGLRRGAAAGRTAARSSPPPTTCASFADQIRPWVADAATSRSAPTGSAAATRAPACGGSSRSTANTS